jgi:lipid-binding SYLF domain-containing protein
MRHVGCAALLLAFVGLGLMGCSTTPNTDEKKEELHDAAKATLSMMRADSPEFASFLDKSYAYAVYPNLGEGSFIVGAGGGRGEVYEQGRMIGYSTMSKANIGLQAGGQAYSQVICFQDSAALHRFIDHQFKFSANAQAVALKSGVAANAKFQDGIAIFQHTKGGLTAGVAVGGQDYAFAPVRND